MNELNNATGCESRRGRATAAARVVFLLTTASISAVGASAQHSEVPDPSQTRPLKYLMVALGQDMNRVNDGLWHGDFEMVWLGAHAIADHPKVPPEQVAAIREALGDGFQEFVRWDQAVHNSALEMAQAAGREDVGATLDAYRALQMGCISCHSAFRDQVRMKLYQQP